MLARYVALCFARKGFVDGLISGGFSFLGGEAANDAMAQQAQMNRDLQLNTSVRQMEFQRDMRASSYQTAVQDMMAAGLNPMLMSKMSADSGGSGAMAQGTSVPTFRNSLGEAVSTALQAKSVLTEVERTEQETRTSAAEESRKNAEAEEIRARTPVHGVTVENLRVQTDVLKQSIDKLIADTRLSEGSARLKEQEIVNLQAQLPKLKQEIETLRAQAGAQIASGKLSDSQRSEVVQRVQNNLPQMERRLRDLELQARQAGMLKVKMDEAAQGTGGGVLGSLFRALSPFTSGAADIVRSMK